MELTSSFKKFRFRVPKIPHMLVIGLLTFTSSCAGPYDTYGAWGPKTGLGAAGGAAAGGLLAAAAGGGAEGIAAGVLLGGLLGGAIGNKLDQNDRRYIQQTAWRSLEHGTACRQPDGQWQLAN
jgi:surface antigen